MNSTGLKKVVLGVDIGGTNTKFGYVDRAGISLAHDAIPTEGNSPPEQFFSRLWGDAGRLLKQIGQEVELAGIGVGAPNANYRKGTIEHPPNIGWDYVDVGAELGKHCSIPVAVTNDANAAALGEMLFGSAREMRDFILITLGTGVGSGIVSNGELLYGADGFAGEIGHTIVDPDGRQCGCGRRGCLETYCSATGLCRTVQQLICTSTEPSRLRSVSYDRLTAQMVSEAARQGDRLALQAFEYTGHVLGLKLSDSVAHLSPEAIILFGGLTAAGDLLFNPTRRSLEEHLFPIYRNKVKLLHSSLDESNAAVLGAGALIWNALSKVRP